jgi:hypothetical protein
MAGGDKFGTIAIRDANGFSHEILHSHAQHVAVGDPVVAGQLIGTMGNTGLKIQDPVKDPNERAHVHYHMKDPAGNVIDPSAFWNQRERFDPNPAPAGFLNEHQRYLRRVDETAGNTAAAPMGADILGPSGTGGYFMPGAVTSSRPPYEARPIPPPEAAGPAENGKDIRRLVRLPARREYLAGFDPQAPAAVPNQIPPPAGLASFDDRFGNWSSFSGVSAPLPISR